MATRRGVQDLVLDFIRVGEAINSYSGSIFLQVMLRLLKIPKVGRLFGREHAGPMYLFSTEVHSVPGATYGK